MERFQAKFIKQGAFRMPRRVSTKQLLIACQMSFEGKSNREIAGTLGFTETTVSNWRKLEVWQEFEAELIKAYKEQVLNFESAAPS
jgi:DNA-binding NarL/FixJ family response regulator